MPGREREREREREGLGFRVGYRVSGDLGIFRSVCSLGFRVLGVSGLGIRML